MNKLQRLECDIEVKFAGDDAPAGTFSGYASVFGNKDSLGDVIQRGAFKNSLNEWDAKGKLPPMLLQHGGFLGPVDDKVPIGIWNEMKEDATGLKVGGRLFALDTDRGKHLHEAMRAGALDGISIGYRAKKFTVGTKPDEPRRLLEEIELVEASVVTFPANDRALIDSVKSVTQADIDDILSLSDAEAFLREADRNWSKKTARDFVSRLAKIARREAGDDHLSGLLEQLRSTRKLVSATS